MCFRCSGKSRGLHGLLFLVLIECCSVVFSDELVAIVPSLLPPSMARPRPPARSAQVVFADNEAMQLAINTDTRGTVQPFTAGSEPTGMQSALTPLLFIVIVAFGCSCGCAEWLAEYKAIRPDPGKQAFVLFVYLLLLLTV